MHSIIQCIVYTLAYNALPHATPLNVIYNTLANVLDFAKP